MFKGHAARGVTFAFVVADRRAPVSAPLGVRPAAREAAKVRRAEDRWG